MGELDICEQIKFHLRVPSNMIHEEYTVSGKTRKEPYSSN
jgi:hypothetical protein